MNEVYVAMNNIYDEPRILGLKGDYQNCIEHNLIRNNTPKFKFDESSQPINLKEEDPYFMPKNTDFMPKNTEDPLLVSPRNPSCNLKKKYPLRRVLGVCLGVVGILSIFGWVGLRKTFPQDTIPLCPVDMSTTFDNNSIIKETIKSYADILIDSLTVEKKISIQDQKINIYSLYPLQEDVYKLIEESILNVKKRFFEIFKLDCNIIEKSLLIRLFHSKKSFHNALNIKRLSIVGVFRLNTISTFIEDNELDIKLIKRISHEYVHFLDFIFNKKNLSFSNEIKWWSEGLSYYLTNDFNTTPINPKGNNQLNYDIYDMIKDGLYSASARVHLYLESRKDLKDFRIEIAKTLRANDHNRYLKLISNFIKNNTEKYSSFYNLNV